MKILFTWLALMGLAFGDVSKVTVEEAEKLVADKIQLVDVRTEEEWNEGHLEGAIRVDFMEKDFSEKVVEVVDIKKPVLIYCRSGGRSGKASKVMADLGFTVIKDLDGGILAWKKAKKKVVK
ncbi:rhodanese-like domain-containing protein [Haloferula sp.]|uniref:rhodanese-like domain-containing protein n=1 Tax=Haloferula sp. TaxID=2497595 RepID=UPI00329CF805